MPRGGRRQGRPGVAYSNRSDLNAKVPIMAAPDQPYGEAGAQRASQQAVPLRNPSAVAPPPSPGSVDLMGPSARPGEPVTAGVPSGAGPGLEALGMGPRPSAALEELRAIYLAFPEEGIRELIEELERGG